MGLFLGSSSLTNEAPSGIRRSGIIFDPVDWSIDRYYMDTKNRNYPGKTEIQKVVVAFIPGGSGNILYRSRWIPTLCITYVSTCSCANNRGCV